MRSRRHPSLIAALLAMAVLLSGADSLADTSMPTVSSPSKWMRHLRVSWAHMDTWTRSEVAHLWGIQRDEDATDTLRSCVRRLDEGVGSCVLALSAMQDVESTPLMRHVLRKSTDPVAIGSAARALSAFDDRFSRDLMLHTLFTVRGGWQATGALLDALEEMPGPWRQMYLAFGSKVVEEPTAQALIAAKVWPPDTHNYRPPVVTALQEAIERWWWSPAPTEADRLGAHAAITSLSRSQRGCPILVEQLFELAVTATKERTAAVLSTVAPTCAHRVRMALAAMGDDPWLVKPMAGGVNPLAPEIPEVEVAEPALWWYVTLSLIGKRTGLMLEESERHELAEDIANAEVLLGLPVGRWDASVQSRLLENSDIYEPPTYSELADTVTEQQYPADFFGFNSFLKQPDWYPQNVHITIDDGPRLPFLPSVLDALERHNVRATFFFVGAALARRWLAHPEVTQGLLNRVVSAGHDVAFHSMNHITEPTDHIQSWEPEQVADSVELYRYVSNKVFGTPLQITRGRLPGGMGRKFPWVKRSFYLAGLHEHVHWNAGPPTWISTTPTASVREQACGLAHRKQPLVLLVHEYKLLGDHLNAFFSVVKNHCPRKPGDHRYEGVAARWER